MEQEACGEPHRHPDPRVTAGASPSVAPGSPGSDPAATADPAATPGFAHPSEAEFARILDFYRIEWKYEPHSFPLRQAPDGRVIERFTPDFYLPELDLYIELTTLKQSLVTKKNRKLRRLRELHPDIKIKLLYNRDYRNLLLKYGVRPETIAPVRGAPARESTPALGASA